MGLRGKGATPLSKRALAPSRNNPWDAQRLSRAERVIAFCEDLTVTSGTAAYTKLRLRPWQRKFIEAVYAENEQGIRSVRTAVLSMGRKNGKSQLAAALALCHLCGPEAESRGEVYSCANDRFQAAKIFAEMVAMINNHPWLADRINISRFLKNLRISRTDRSTRHCPRRRRPRWASRLHLSCMTNLGNPTIANSMTPWIRPWAVGRNHFCW